MIYDLEDLKKKIEKETKMDYEDFKKKLKIFADNGLINTGHLSEFYCKIILDLESAPKSNTKGYDLIKKEIKYQVKYRKGNYSNMEFNIGLFDFVLVVFLDEDSMLPEKIHCISVKELKQSSKNEKRYSYAKSVKNPETIIFQRKKT